VSNGDTYRINSTTLYPIDGNTWMHVAATFDGITMRLYINGVLEASLIPPAGTTIATNNLPLTIGAEDGTTASRWFMGWMDNARVYNRALSAGEIQRLAGYQTLTVSKTGTGSGTVTSTPLGIDCGATCSFDFAENTPVTLTTAPAAGSVFSGWSGACTGLGDCSVTMSEAKSVNASFDPVAFATTLQLGWNLVSFNLVPQSPLITDVLSSIAGSYDLVYAWDATGGHSSSGNWMSYAPSVQYGNTLTSITEQMGLWIHVTTGNPVLSVNGSLPIATTITLSTMAGGWNLVGFPAATGKSLPEVIPVEVNLVYAYHANNSDPWLMYDRLAPTWVNDLLSLTPAWGYWVQVTGPAEWIVAYP
jgi:hypothetical protein